MPSTRISSAKSTTTSPAARAILRRHEEIAERVLALPDDGGALSEEDRVLVARARKIRRFFSQPFFVAERFTGTAGQYVPIAETVKGFKEILDGKCDDMPESAFLYVGSIEQAREKARREAGDERPAPQQQTERGQAEEEATEEGSAVASRPVAQS